MIHCPRVHKIYLFQTNDSLQKTRIVDFNWSKWRGKISWIIRRLRLTGEEFFILDKRWTLPRYDRAPECGATGVTGTAMTFMQIASVIVNTPRGNRFHSRFPFKEDSIASRRILSSPLPPLLPLRKWRASLRRSYAVARFRVEFRCKYGFSIAVRRSMISIWIAFDEISHDSGNGWLESGTGRFCTATLPPNVHWLFATTYNLGFDGKHDRICYVIVFFHFWRYFYRGLLKSCSLFFCKGSIEEHATGRS